ncbi:AraC family transcriptional regulator [Patiriisocius sp. Uisw_017]
MNELKTNKIFRKYSTKAIAEECGFNSGGTFSRVFYNTKGLKPLYYIKNLEKNVGYWLSKKIHNLLPYSFIFSKLSFKFFTTSEFTE